MITLAIEQSTPEGTAILLSGTETLAQIEWRDERRKPQQLVGALRDLFKRAAVAPADVMRYAVGLGPGGFAGLRTSLAVARALALPASRPVHGLSSGMACAAQSGRTDGEVIVVGDARRERLWIGRFDMTGVTPAIVGEYSLIRLQQLQCYVKDSTTVVTSDWDRLRDALGKLELGDCLVTEAVIPRADTLAQLLETGGDSTLNPASPIYLHPPVFIEPRFPVQAE